MFNLIWMSVMKLGRPAIIGIALVPGLLAGLLILSKDPAPKVDTPAPSAEVQMEEILIAASQIEPGTELQTSHLRWSRWPANSVPRGAILRSMGVSKARDMIGKIVVAQLLAGDPIRETHVDQITGNYMATVLKKGMRAVSLPIDSRSAAGGFVLPGDRVDIIVTSSGMVPGESVNTRTVLSNILVLAIDNATIGEVDAKSLPVNEAAILEVTQPQSEVLARLPQSGSVTLALRSGRDTVEEGDDGQIVQPETIVKMIRHGQVQNVTVR